MNFRFFFSFFLLLLLSSPIYSFDPPVFHTQDGERLFFLGKEYLKLNQLEQAEEAFKKSLVHEPFHESIHWELGWVFWKRQNWEKVIEHWSITQKRWGEKKRFQKYYLMAQSFLPPTKKFFFNSDSKTITLVAVGDTMMGSNFPDDSKMPENQGREIFQDVFPYLKGDLLFGNLEAPLTDLLESEKCKYMTVCYAFRMPPAFGSILKKTGFNLMSLANNHALDFGKEGLQDTMRILQNNQIAYFGPWKKETAILEKDGFRVGFLGVATSPCCLHITQIDKVSRLVKKLKNKVDLVVVSFHGGAEGSAFSHTPQEVEIFYEEDRGSVREFSYAVIDAGADLVLGHGPHTLRGMELYQGKLIAYSLGNFVGYKRFNTTGALQYSMILHVDLTKEGKTEKIRVIPLKMSPLAVPKFDPKGISRTFLNELSREDFGERGVILDKKGIWQSP